MSEDNVSAKRALRAEMKARRAAEPCRTEKDFALAQNFFSLPAVREAWIFFLYRSFSSEAGTSLIAERLLSEGKQVLFPRVDGANMVAVQWKGQAFRKGAFGIEEPHGEPYEGKIDVCALPLLAADADFARLGYGGGFYDRFLSDRQIYKIGVCYDFQIVGKVPGEPHDVLLDAIATDKHIYIRR